MSRAEERRDSFAGFFGLAAAFRLVLLAKVAATLLFCLAALAFVALRARAFPAVERLVAGFKRVALLATTRLRDDEVAAERRDVERGESFFTLLAIGLLMR